MLKLLSLLSTWDQYSDKRFSRETELNTNAIACDCSGLINLLFEHASLPLPYGLARPKAVHYFNVLQELGSDKIAKLAPGHMLAWRKDQLPKSGDTGHVLIVAEAPEQLAQGSYLVSVYDATKACGGLSKRQIALQVNEQGQIIGVRLHLDGSIEGATKVKRCAIYHAPIEGSRYCFGCALPSKVCQCAQVEPSLVLPNIVVLRHPDERGRTLSTVSLIKQRYPNVLVKEGEQFAPLRMPNLALLYPDDELVEPGDVAHEQANSQLQTLILLDATWRKAKKMLHLNPWLASLPKVALQAEQVSHYLLRKIPNEGALSSVEAFAQAAGDEALNALFINFMNRQIALMGEEVYLRNYRKHLNYQA